MYDKIRKKYPFNTNKQALVCLTGFRKKAFKLCVFVVIAGCCMLFSISLYAQSESITLPKQQLSLRELIKEIEGQTIYRFVYSSEAIDDRKIYLQFGSEVDLRTLLEVVFTPLGLTYTIYKKKIIVKQRREFPFMPIRKSNSVSAAKIKKMIVGKIFCQEDSIPIVGASVRVKNKLIGTASDLNGYYSLNCLAEDTLLISAIGYHSKLIVVGAEVIEDIYLEVNTIALGEVSVIGYGEEPKVDKMGAMTSIPLAEYTALPTHFDESLAGGISGLWFQKSSGAPGGASTIAIRGVTSLQPDANSPLVVVDGVPLFDGEENLNMIRYRSNVGFPAWGLSNNYVVNDIRENDEFSKNSWNMIHPEDIESITVLKDAYSTSIYGSRGAAGVVLITTKKAHSKGLQVNIYHEIGISQPVGKPKIMNAKEYADFYSNYYSLLKGEEVFFPNNVSTNWYDSVIRNACCNLSSFSMQNRTETGSWYFSLSKLNQESYVEGCDFDRYTARLNSTMQLNSWIQLGTNLSLSIEKNNSLLAPKIYRDAILKAPNIAIQDSNGEYIYDKGENPSGNLLTNPVAMARNDKGEVIDQYIIANSYANFELLPFLSYRFDLGINFITTDAISDYFSGNSEADQLTLESGGYSRKWIVTNTLQGEQKIEDHFFRFVVGQSYEESDLKEEYFTYRNKHSKGGLNKEDAIDFNSEDRRYALASWFGRVSYKYRKRWYAGVSFRVDGSSRFKDSQRYQFFPAYSLAYQAFYNQDHKYLNQLKLRASFGYSGVEQSSYTYGAVRTYQYDPNQLTYGNQEILSESNGENLNLSWEKTKNFDIGMDFSCFQNRIAGSLDYYRKKVNNLLLYTDVPSVTGYSKQWINVGAMENAGLEIDLSAKIVEGDLNWELSLSAAYNRNKVLKLNYAGEILWDEEQAYKYFEEGREAGQFYLNKWMGVHADTGNPLWKYADGTISETPPADVEDRVSMGSGMPKFTGGIRNKINYKNFELSVLLTFAQGKKLMNGTAALLHTYSTSEAFNLSPDVQNYWRVKGDQTNEPALSNQSVISTKNYITSRTSSRFYEDASFLRVKNIVAAYSLPQKWVNRFHIREAKIIAKATNVATFTSYSGADPEVSAFGTSSLLSGYDELTMPQAKTYSLGIRLGF